jgi:bifunctional oligoribonuclease and PAP phosphatase NrnA
MQSPSAFHDALRIPRRVLITFHYNPDADALGSALALAAYLNKKGHHCTVVSPNAIPDFLLWMPGALHVLNWESQRNNVLESIGNAEILCCLDFNHYSRTQSMADTLAAFSGITVLIDHHLFPDTVFTLAYSNPAKSSTCEMVYDMINAGGDNELIDTAIGACLYAGTMTDTGSFKFSCTTASVHAMVADLMQKGLNPVPVHQAIFDTFEENRLRFVGYMLSEKMCIFKDSHAALLSVSKEEMNRYRLKTGDTEGLVNYPLSIKDVIFSTFISERDHEIRMSFRSKGTFDVNAFARKYFNGGGHANAAGGRSTESLTQTIDTLTQIITQTEPQLKQCYSDLI